MGRRLRNGKQTPSLSPPNKRGVSKKNDNNTATVKSQVSKVNPSKKAVPSKNKRQSKKEESSSEDEEEIAKQENSSSEEEESGSDSESDSDDDVKNVAPAPLKKATSSKKKQQDSSSSEEEEESDSGSEDEDSDDDDDDGKDKGFTDGKYLFCTLLYSAYVSYMILYDLFAHNIPITCTYIYPLIENANWLKPKQSKMQLMSSDDEEDDEFGGGAANEESSDDDDDDEMLEVERQSRLLDAEMKLEAQEASAELQRTIAQQTSIYHLPTIEEIADDENRVVPPSELRARIEDILEVLADFKNRREEGRSRSEYIERLGQDMAELFGYLQELVDYFLDMFGPNECLEFLEASDKSRPLVVRVNTLKARRKDLAAALMKRGVRLDPLAPWSKVGLKIYESTVPIGATPEYLAGHYMLQSAASMCPVMALAPQPGDRVMDMSAAPGGKTSYISQLMRNKGVVIANDLKPERQKATVANLHRLGVRNVVTCCYDGRKLGAQMRNSFDRILLDAPCSGLGVISRDPSVKVQRTMPDVLRCGHLQKELLVGAIDALNHKSKKGGGYMVYSTCSVAVAENEEVINYLLSKRDVKLVDTGLDFGKLYLMLVCLLVVGPTLNFCLVSLYI